MSAPRPRIGVLALGTFAIGTDGFVIAGVLPGIAHDTGATLAAAGLLVTAFALVCAAAAAACTARASRGRSDRVRAVLVRHESGRALPRATYRVTRPRSPSVAPLLPAISCEGHLP